MPCPMRRAPARLLLLPALVALGACATTKAIPTTGFVPPSERRAASLEELRAAYDGYCRGLETWSASGDVAVSDFRKGQQRSVGIRLVAARGGRLYMKGSVAMVTALELVSDGERFWFSLPTKKTVWTGPARADETAGEDVPDADAPYRALRPRDITDALLPDPLAPAAGEALLVEADAKCFTLTLARVDAGAGSVRRRVELDRASLELRGLALHDAQGELETEVRFSDWRQGTPYRVVLSRPRDGYEAAFVFGKVQKNVSVPAQAFVPRLPPNYAVKNLED
jgi:outer membrane lipoprotein-sorting protein